MKLLTIGIPTYNRKECVLSLVCQIRDSGLLDLIEVIVIDDASKDGTYQQLEKELRNSPSIEGSVRLIRHDINQGMAAGFIHLFELCQTKFLMMFADDDEIYPDGITRVISTLASADPDFLCTGWLSSGDAGRVTCRGRSDAGPIPAYELRNAANHAPGLVYKVASVRAFLTYLWTQLGDDHYAMKIYPQVCTAYLLLLNDGVMQYCPAIPGGYRIHGAMPSGLNDTHGNHWSSMVGRWREQTSFEDFFNTLEQPGSPVENCHSNKLAVIRSTLRLHRIESFSRVHSGIESERPDLSDPFDAGAVYYVMRRPVRSFRLLLYYLLTRLRH